MKAAIYPGQGQSVVIENLDDPVPGPDEVVIKVHRCGICGTDLSMTRGGTWEFAAGSQLGHEYSGEIVEVGNQVVDLRVGERISVLPSPACGHCAACRSHGNHVLCQNKPGTAMRGFAEYARLPANLATRLPNTLSMTDGALIEPLAISLYGVKFAHIQPGDRVLVLGAGTVALYAIYWARRLGAGRIVAMSRSDRRRALALQMGADEFISYGPSEVAEVAQALGGAPQVVFEGVGAEGMLHKSVQHAAQFGRIVSLGFCTAPDPVIPALGSYKCVSIQFAVGYSMKEFIYIADQMDKGHADPKVIVSREIALQELPSMMAKLRTANSETKVHVSMAA